MECTAGCVVLLLAVHAAAQVCSKSDPAIPPCAAPNFPEEQQRVRKEIRDLSTEEWRRVVAAVWKMKTTDNGEGQSKYGPRFRPYDYFVVKHALMSYDSRGDQSHFSNGMPTWHGAFILEFETSLLAVDPSISGLPYWDETWNPFSPEWFGSAPGTGPDFQVIDGEFANWSVLDNFDMSVWEPFLSSAAPPGVTNTYFGSPEGFLRDKKNFLKTKTITRFGTPFFFPREGQEACAQKPGCWYDWYQCIEGYDWEALKAFHWKVHPTVGGVRWKGQQKHGGDYEDPSTAPNEPFFMFHHANVDRNRLKWMQNRIVEKPSYWGFAHICHLSWQACAGAGKDLADIASALFPFSAEQLGFLSLKKASEGVTHADILCHMGPGTAPYRYEEPRASLLLPAPEPLAQGSKASRGYRVGSCWTGALLLTALAGLKIR